MNCLEVRIYRKHDSDPFFPQYYGPLYFKEKTFENTAERDTGGDALEHPEMRLLLCRHASRKAACLSGAVCRRVGTHPAGGCRQFMVAIPRSSFWRQPPRKGHI